MGASLSLFRAGIRGLSDSDTSFDLSDGDIILRLSLGILLHGLIDRVILVNQRLEIANLDHLTFLTSFCILDQ